MTAAELNNLSNSYQLTPVEINCILLYFICDNKTQAFSYTVAYKGKQKNKDILAYQFFTREAVKTFIEQQKNNFVNNTFVVSEETDAGTEQNRTDKKTNADPDIDITSENIKDILQSEFKKISDPDKRAVILMKIADFVGLKNSDAEDPLTPTIYLPARCSTCNQLKDKE
jgi:hypothetical protein